MTLEDFVAVNLAEAKWKIRDYSKRLDSEESVIPEMVAWAADPENAGFPVDVIMTPRKKTIASLREAIDAVTWRIERYCGDKPEDKEWVLGRFNGFEKRKSAYLIEDCKKQLGVAEQVLMWAIKVYPRSIANEMERIGAAELVALIKKKIDSLESAS
jgi:hypothetical protein